MINLHSLKTLVGKEKTVAAIRARLVSGYTNDYQVNARRSPYPPAS
jgi:hypothetical protein